MFSYLGMEESSKLGGPNGLAGHPHLKTLTLQDNRQGEQDGETRMSDHTIIHNSPIPAEEVPLGISSHSSSRIFAAMVSDTAATETARACLHAKKLRRHGAARTVVSGHVATAWCVQTWGSRGRCRLCGRGRCLVQRPACPWRLHAARAATVPPHW